ncbi:MAG: hypothetical protein ACE5OZ_17190 [Candidatus Heimdallarchaeota archaeon]
MKRIQINDLVVLGRAAPDRMKNGRISYCVAGYSQKYGFLRLYPTNVQCPLYAWNIVEVPVEQNRQDTRYESWKIVGSQASWATLHEKIEVKGSYKKKHRRQIPWNLRESCCENLNDQRRSLGIIQPVEIKGFFKEREQLLEEEKQKQLSLEHFLDLAPREDDWIKTKGEYDFVPYIRYKCPQCRTSQGFHEQQLISIEAYEWMRKNPDNIDQLWTNYNLYNPEYDIYLFVGNQKIHRNSFMVISILRFKKTNYPLTYSQPLVPWKKYQKPK